MDQSSSSEFTITKKEPKFRKMASREETQKQGRWGLQQNLKYLVFLSYNQSKFECKKKRMFRLYKPFSKFIKTRTSEQCRSHHRKLLQRFKTPKNIISTLEDQFEAQEIAQVKSSHNELLKQLLIPQKKIKLNEKQQQFSERPEQKFVDQNQNEKNALSQLNQKKTDVGPESTTQPRMPLLTQNFNIGPELPLLNYQALNWINQLYLSNFNWFLEQNRLSCYNGFATRPANFHNY